MPKVETSSIKKDLYRRDFTINTLAVRLNSEGYGDLIDYFGGQRDIRDRVVRVLHNLSFVEDPTRAYRAVRFAERFRFRISKHTENLIKSALKLNLFDKLSGARLYDELLLTFNETEPVMALKHLSRYKLLGIIHTDLKFSQNLERILNDVHETLVWYDLLFLGDEPNRPLMYLMALFSELDEAEISSALTRLSTPEREKDKIMVRIGRSRQTMKNLFRDDPVSIYRVLNGLDLETLLYTMALCRDKRRQKAISKYLVDLRGIENAIKGDDLKKLSIPPGPVYAEILDRVLEEKLRGNLASKNEEIEFVKKIYKVPKKTAQKRLNAKKGTAKKKTKKSSKSKKIMAKKKVKEKSVKKTTGKKKIAAKKKKK
ncbi:MAG: CCA tRNA nucleotidyltransferase [Nitrospirota bacterium]|nr:MAG: CCA tRNA nucleotidyltransferase [Nitrospirota bacterium]